MNDTYLAYLLFLMAELYIFCLGISTLVLFLKDIVDLMEKLEEKYETKKKDKKFKIKLYTLLTVGITGGFIQIFILGIIMHYIIIKFTCL